MASQQNNSRPAHTIEQTGAGQTGTGGCLNHFTVAKRSGIVQHDEDISSNTRGGRNAATTEAAGSRGRLVESQQRRLIRGGEEIVEQLSKTDVKGVGAKVKVNPDIARYIIPITTK